LKHACSPCHEAQSLTTVRWTMIITDETLYNIARVCHEYKAYSVKVLKLHPDRAQGQPYHSLSWTKTFRDAGALFVSSGLAGTKKGACSRADGSIKLGLSR
jgi:hypothetical protein